MLYTSCYLLESTSQESTKYRYKKVGSSINNLMLLTKVRRGQRAKEGTICA